MSDETWEINSTNGEDDDWIEPGSPRFENVIFVLLGVLSTLAVVLHLIGQFA